MRSSLAQGKKIKAGGREQREREKGEEGGRKTKAGGRKEGSDEMPRKLEQ